MIAATGVGYRVGSAVLLAEVTLRVAPGELVSVVGPNGAGKSTLLSLLAGDRRASTGQVRLDGLPINGLRPRELARRRAVMPQASALAFGFTAVEVVRLGSGTDSLTVARAALARVQAQDLADRPFPTLSGGEQARVTLARILAQDTAIVLLDEPTAHLDIKHQHAVLGIARQLADEGRTVVAVLHDLNLAAQYSDSIALLRGGELVAHGRPDEVLVAGRLSQVYEHPIQVHAHPSRRGPLCLP